MRIPDLNDAPPDPQPEATPERETPAKDLAYKGVANPVGHNLYRLERGFPFQRAGKTITALPQFRALTLFAPSNASGLTSFATTTTNVKITYPKAAK